MATCPTARRPRRSCCARPWPRTPRFASAWIHAGVTPSTTRTGRRGLPALRRESLPSFRSDDRARAVLHPRELLLLPGGSGEGDRRLRGARQSPSRPRLGGGEPDRPLYRIAAGPGKGRAARGPRTRTRMPRTSEQTGTPASTSSSGSGSRLEPRRTCAGPPSCSRPRSPTATPPSAGWSLLPFTEDWLKGDVGRRRRRARPRRDEDRLSRAERPRHVLP